MKHPHSANKLKDNSINLIWHRLDILGGAVLLFATFEQPHNNNLLDNKKELSGRYGLKLPATLQNATKKRQQEFIIGRLCARQALLALDALEHVPAINEDGSPQWAAGYIGSITHTHNKNASQEVAYSYNQNQKTIKVASIVAHQDAYLGIGLDIEPLMSTKNLQSLSSKILTVNELAHFGDVLAAEMSFVVTLIFSLKESLFKALYPIVGKRFYFQDAEVISIDGFNIDRRCFDKKCSGKNGTARLRLLNNLNAEWSKGSECEAVFRCIDDCILTVVYVRP